MTPIQDIQAILKSYASPPTSDFRPSVPAEGVCHRMCCHVRWSRSIHQRRGTSGSHDPGRCQRPEAVGGILQPRKIPPGVYRIHVL